ncbi:hypothetical protein SAMN04488118_11615 [Epibacterium ulvae]|uniref:Uncharacterized protein n=1 Tax=Epibacterium ulvae TaxID=1156985 RepID=A0A1G5RGB1_9RHOB|nr:hypothetical protein SAMN04488118_11615 [Epibacterium ulvae]
MPHFTRNILHWASFISFAAQLRFEDSQFRSSMVACVHEPLIPYEVADRELAFI